MKRASEKCRLLLVVFRDFKDYRVLLEKLKIGSEGNVNSFLKRKCSLWKSKYKCKCVLTSGHSV